MLRKYQDFLNLSLGEAKFLDIHQDKILNLLVKELGISDVATCDLNVGGSSPQIIYTLKNRASDMMFFHPLTEKDIQQLKKIILEYRKNYEAAPGAAGRRPPSPVSFFGREERGRYRSPSLQHDDYKKPDPLTSLKAAIEFLRNEPKPNALYVDVIHKYRKDLDLEEHLKPDFLVKAGTEYAEAAIKILGSRLGNVLRPKDIVDIYSRHSNNETFLNFLKSEGNLVIPLNIALKQLEDDSQRKKYLRDNPSFFSIITLQKKEVSSRPSAHRPKEEPIAYAYDRPSPERKLSSEKAMKILRSQPENAEEAQRYVELAEKYVNDKEIYKILKQNSDNLLMAIRWNPEEAIKRIYGHNLLFPLVSRSDLLEAGKKNPMVAKAILQTENACGLILSKFGAQGIIDLYEAHQKPPRDKILLEAKGLSKSGQLASYIKPNKLYRCSSFIRACYDRQNPPRDPNYTAHISAPDDEKITSFIDKLEEKSDKTSKEEKLLSDYSNLCCPITRLLLVNPVEIKGGVPGKFYSKAAIEEWLKTKNTDPSTNLSLKDPKLITAPREVVEQLDNFRKEVLKMASLAAKAEVASPEVVASPKPGRRRSYS